MSWETYQAVAVLNLAVCLGIVWACICRLSSDTCKVYKQTRTRYSLLLGAALASGFQPTLFQEWPGRADLIITSAVLVGLAINAYRWGSFVGPQRRKEDK